MRFSTTRRSKNDGRARCRDGDGSIPRLLLISARLDLAAIERVREEVWPQVDRADELHDALVELGFMTPEEGRDWDAFPRASLRPTAAPRFITRARRTDLWVAAERLAPAQRDFPDRDDRAADRCARSVVGSHLESRVGACRDRSRKARRTRSGDCSEGLADSLGLKLQ